MLTRYRSNLEIFISPGKETSQADVMDSEEGGALKRIGPPDPPAGRPLAVADPSGGRCAVITWSSPPYDGGRCVDGYLVEGRTESEAEWRPVAERCHSLSVVVRDLAAGRRYVFRVRAENVHGLSEPSAQSLPYCTPALTECGDEPPPPPFAPRLVTVEPMEGEAGFASRYELLEELGKGRYGVVHRVTERATGHTLAAKLIRTIKAKDRQQVHDEIAIMNVLRHPKLLQLAAAFEGSKEMVMVMEYISGGELFERVVADDFTLTERDCILFMRQICEGVDYMHQSQVVHLDLKPENIMCQTRTSHQIKLIDFGLAQRLKPDTPVRVLFGTPEFIPPEIINYEPIGTESDMWSVGVICYVLLSGLSPFMGDNDAETFANITRADFDFDDEAFDAISQDARDFISALLVKRKEKRLTARQCLDHPWLAQQPANMSCIALSTDKLKKFIIRRKWQKTGNAIRALGRMATLSAASRRNSAASSAPGTPRPSLASAAPPPLSKEDSLEDPAAAPAPTRLDDTAEEVAEEVAAEEAVVEEAVTATLLPRGRFRSERSDSGISDCSSASSKHRAEAAPAPAALFGKKFSISEEADEPPAAPAEESPSPPAPAAPAVRPSNLPLPAPAPAALRPPLAKTPAPIAAPLLTQPAKAAAHDGTSTVSRRSAELLQKLASNSVSPPPAAAAGAAAGAAGAAGSAGVAALERKGAAGHAAHKAAGLGRLAPAPLRSPTKTRAGFVESKIKCLESQGSSGALQPPRVSVTEAPCSRERPSLRDSWRGRTASPSRVASPSRSPNRTAALSPCRREAALSPSRREALDCRTATDSPSRTTVLSSRPVTDSPSRTTVLSSRTVTDSPNRRAVPSNSPVSPAQQSRLQQPQGTPPSPRKAPLDTGLGPRGRNGGPVANQDSPPKSPTLRRMLAPNKLGAHSAGFQKTLEFWKR
ncbi:Myosin light chain kinase, smooth muscle [Frankliniella fusca]|uniref:Myosin light chain kinase, smooth muscle n=1 Tax=Frankliniella fusca TaxID=407009 RepID=A0AAE1LKD1_9NEOP|nr:Myosin light chain kinase, smooth muscle [Frankliniella fusca]